MKCERCMTIEPTKQASDVVFERSAESWVTPWPGLCFACSRFLMISVFGGKQDEFLKYYRRVEVKSLVAKNATTGPALPGSVDTDTEPATSEDAEEMKRIIGSVGKDLR